MRLVLRLVPKLFIRSGCSETCGASLDSGPEGMNSVAATIVHIKLLGRGFSFRPAYLAQLLPLACKPKVVYENALACESKVLFSLLADLLNRIVVNRFSSQQ